MACLVSFRALFSQNERPPKSKAQRARQYQQPGTGSKPVNQSDGSTTIVGQGSSSNASRGTLNNVFRPKSRFKVFQDSILDTCRTLEGLDDDDAMVEMDPLATIDHTRPDITAELGNIGGFQNMVEGTGQTIPIRSSHDSLENLTHEQDAAERDSQGVSAMEENNDVDAEMGEVPRRRDTVSSNASQLSLDSLYMSRGDHSQRPSTDVHGMR